MSDKELDYRDWVDREILAPVVRRIEAAPVSAKRDAVLAKVRTDRDAIVEFLVGAILKGIGPKAPRPALGPAEMQALERLRADPELQKLLAESA